MRRVFDGWNAGAAALFAATLVMALAIASVPGGSAPAEAGETSEYFITLTKVLEPSDDPGRFNLFIENLIEPLASGENLGDGDHIGVLPLETSTTFRVGETLGDESPAGITLEDYSIEIVCVQGEEEIASGAGPSLEFTTQQSLTVDCTITNTRIEPAPLDCDRDGLTDDDELRFGTDPCNADTDGDGRSDADELFIDNTDPTDRTNTPPTSSSGGFLTCPQAGAFSPPLGPGTTLTNFGGGTVGGFQDAISEAGYHSGTFTLQNGLRAFLPADPNDPLFPEFFVGFDGVELHTAITPPVDIEVLRNVEIPACTPTFLDDTSQIFADGFESGDTSTWSSTVP